ncbi:hypothetical protein BC826DRAFT_634314 [Russula brevipes]|nr:hypothetical protein BC826DRAFT_634314 [Russula brevipes]
MERGEGCSAVALAYEGCRAVPVGEVVSWCTSPVRSLSPPQTRLRRRQRGVDLRPRQLTPPRRWLSLAVRSLVSLSPAMRPFRRPPSNRSPAVASRAPPASSSMHHHRPCMAVHPLSCPSCDTLAERHPGVVVAALAWSCARPALLSAACASPIRSLAYLLSSSLVDR